MSRRATARRPKRAPGKTPGADIAALAQSHPPTVVARLIELTGSGDAAVRAAAHRELLERGFDGVREVDSQAPRFPAGLLESPEPLETAAMREVLARIARRNVGKLQGWLDQVAKDSPEKAAELLLRLLEFSLPRLSLTRVETPGRPSPATCAERPDDNQTKEVP